MNSAVGEIIRRLENLGGPDRHLDYLIALVAGHAVYFEGSRELLLYDRNTNKIRYTQHANSYKTCPGYTGSIDAALTLQEILSNGWILDHAGDDAIGELGDMKIIGHTVEFTDGITKVQGGAPTKPIAYCLAIFKACQIDEKKRARMLNRSLNVARCA